VNFFKLYLHLHIDELFILLTLFAEKNYLDYRAIIFFIYEMLFPSLAQK